MEAKIFNISSFQSSTKSKFTFNLPSNYHNIAYLRLLSIEIPHTIYTFSSAKDNLTFTITYSGSDYTITISEGNYSDITLLLEIQDKLNVINVTTGQDFQISRNTISNKIIIENTIGNIFTLDFTRLTSSGTTGIYPNIGYYLGYTEETYSGLSTYTGLNQLNLIDTNYIYLRLNNIENIRDPIVHYAFCKIMMKNNEINTYYIREEDIIGSSYYFRGPINLKKIDIELIDYKGELLTIAPFNVSLTLEAGIVYDSKLYHSVHHFKNTANFGTDNRLTYKY